MINVKSFATPQIDGGNKMWKPSLVLAIGLCFGLSGCQTTSGTPAVYDQTKLAQISKGYSTKEDLSRLFGKPQHMSHNSDGTEVWDYEYSERTSGCLGPMGLVLDGHFCESSKWTIGLSFYVSPANIVTDYKRL